MRAVVGEVGELVLGIRGGNRDDVRKVERRRVVGIPVRVDTVVAGGGNE